MIMFVANNNKTLMVWFCVIAIIAVMLGVSVIAKPGMAMIVLSLLLTFVVSAISLIKPIMPVYVALFLATSSSMTKEMSFYAGDTQVSLSGLLWLGLIWAMLLHVLFRKKVYMPRYAWFFVFFVIWIGIRLVIEPTGFIGVKDLVWYAAPLVTIIYVSSLKIFHAGNREKWLNRLESVFVLSLIFVLLIFAVALLTGEAQYTAVGPRGAFIGSSRGVALYLLMILAVVISSWRYGQLRRRGKFFSVLTLGAILLTLGRTASFLATVLFVMKWVNHRRIWKVIMAGIVSLMVFYVLTSNVPILKQRFFFVESWEFSQGVRGINTAGRNVMWVATYESAIQEPILGKGLGSAREYLTSIVKSKNIIEWHPHNEYLQVFHDAGIIGVLLFALAWFSLLITQWKSWRVAQATQKAQWSMAAFMATMVVLLSSITDNTMHYPFVVIPCSILCGISYAISVNNK